MNIQNSSKVYFISGVCGVGKSSVLKHLRGLLPYDKYDIRDFDERSVPDGGGLEWHNSETLHWLEVSSENATNNLSTIICGFADPARFWGVYKASDHPPAKLFLLHASGETIRKRLLGRHSTPESIVEINRTSGVPLDEFIENNISYAPKLYKIFEKDKSFIIDTESKTPEEVAGEIIESL